jgi:hypothetical protein
MAMEKYNKAEGKLEVLAGHASHVLNDHFHRTGKYSVSEFNDEEKAAFESDLQAAMKADEAEQKDLARQMAEKQTSEGVDEMGVSKDMDMTPKYIPESK